MKKKPQTVVKVISIFFEIVGVSIVVFDIVMKLGAFHLILGFAFIIAGILAYKTGMAHLNEIFRNNN